MAEWDDYKIKIPKQGVREDDVSVLQEINHVVHPAPPHAASLRTGRSALVSSTTRAA